MFNGFPYYRTNTQCQRRTTLRNAKPTARGRYLRAAMEVLEARTLLSDATLAVIITQPTSGVEGQPLSTIKVALEDQQGDIITTDHSVVTLSYASGSTVDPNAKTVLATQPAQNGVATFTGVTINLVGTFTLCAQFIPTEVTSSMLALKIVSPQQLVVISEPSSTPSINQSLGTVQIAIEDLAGNILTNDQSSVTLAISQNDQPPPFTDGITNLAPPKFPQTALQGTTIVQAQNGIATFSGLSIDASGTYYFGFGDQDYTPVVSSPIHVTSAATHLVFLTEPVDKAFVAQSIGTVEVALEDANGNLVTNDQVPVRISLAGAAPPQTSQQAPVPSDGATGTTINVSSNIFLSGNQTLTFQNGIATFTGLSIFGSGNFTLSATAGDLPAISSSPIWTAESGKFLVFLTQPSDALPGASLGTVKVAVEDGFGNLLSDDNSTITLETPWSTNKSWVLQGTTEVTAEHGIATFSNLSVLTPGSLPLYARFADTSISDEPFESDAFTILDPTAAPVTPTDPTAPTNPTPPTDPIPPTGTPTTLTLPPVTLVASFDDTAGNDSASGLVMDAKGNLFGETFDGGTDQLGSLFEIPSGSSSIKTLASFTGTNGSNPFGRLTIDAKGNLYGGTEKGGTDNDGVVFMLAKGSTTITVLASFDGTDGTDPHGMLLRDSAGNLYGTTLWGGANNDGTVFELPKGKHAITTLATFNGTNGEHPSPGLTLDAHGNLYGSAIGSGVGDSTVAPTVFGSHEGLPHAQDGRLPYGGSALGPNGNRRQG